MSYMIIDIFKNKSSHFRQASVQLIILGLEQQFNPIYQGFYRTTNITIPSTFYSRAITNYSNIQ